MTDPNTTNGTIHGTDAGDEGEPCVLRYQSPYHPDADKTTVEGTVDAVHPDSDILFIVDDQGRTLEVTPTSVLIYETADGENSDQRIGDDPEVDVKRLYEVYVDGVTRKFVRASDDQSARERAIDATDFGEMNDMTDANAASRIDDEELDRQPDGDNEVYDA